MIEYSKWRFWDVVCTLASRFLNFYLCPRGGKVPLLNIAKTRATEKNCFDFENLSETECRQERKVVNTGSLYHFE